MTSRLLAIAVAVAVSTSALPALGQPASSPKRDEFFWLGEINKATTVINSEQGLLDKATARRIGAGLAKMLDEARQPGAKRPATVITFEPVLIRTAGIEATLLHAGRSSQDMHATYRAAIMRDNLLNLAAQLNVTATTLVGLAQKHAGTMVPNYTNGVAAQANSYGHYLLGYAASLDRMAQRIRETYARVDQSPMGTTVLNGTSWPLDRQRMAAYLGFGTVVNNAYDAGQILSAEYPAEVGAIVSSIALQAGSYVEDVMTQYAQSRPWILLQEGGGNTYVSSAMPQKRNPGLLNSARSHASTAVTLAMGPVLQAHNIPPGMSDAKDVKANTEMVDSGIRVLRDWDRILKALVLSPERALEELNSDWTASQEIADTLMRKYGVPFRLGHHFASEIVDYAKANDIRPSDFPYEQARRIWLEAGKDYNVGALPMSEAEFRGALHPENIVKNRATSGGPQAAEMERMLRQARERLAEHAKWVSDRRAAIDVALGRLDRDFGRLVGDGK